MGAVGTVRARVIDDFDSGTAPDAHGGGAAAVEVEGPAGIEAVHQEICKLLGAHAHGLGLTSVNGNHQEMVALGYGDGGTRVSLRLVVAWIFVAVGAVLGDLRSSQRRIDEHGAARVPVVDEHRGAGYDVVPLACAEGGESALLVDGESVTVEAHLEIAVAVVVIISVSIPLEQTVNPRKCIDTMVLTVRIEKIVQTLIATCGKRWKAIRKSALQYSLIRYILRIVIDIPS